MCNRDERRTRPAALAPRVHDLGGRRALFACDPQGGGTWIGVNDVGLIVTLLNVLGPPRGQQGHARRSRGLVVRELLQCVSLSQAMAAAASLDPGAFEAFQIAIVHRRTVAHATSDGVKWLTRTQWSLDEPCLFTSSSLGDALAGPPRYRLFTRLVLRSRRGWLDGQARFHRHQWSRHPEISVRMERSDALTVSRTTVDVTEEAQRMLYEAPLDAEVPRAGEWCFLR